MATPATELHMTLGALGLAQCRIAQLFGVGPRSVRRWQHGDRRVPRGVDILLKLVAVGAVTIAEVERAAIPVSAQTNGNGDAHPELVAAQSTTLAHVETATLVDPDLTTETGARNSSSAGYLRIR